MIIDLGVQRQRWEGKKGYEGCYDCECETQEEGTGKHSEKITNSVEKGRGVEGVSCTHLAVGGDGTTRKMTPHTQNRVPHMKERHISMDQKRSQYHYYNRSKYCYS